jgi:hypothetical protein
MMAARARGPAAPVAPDALEGSVVDVTRMWSDCEVASLCIAQGLMGLVETATKGRQPALTEWRRVYRAFMDAAVTGRLDYAASRKRTQLKERVEQIRQAYGSSKQPRAKKKAGA